MKMEDGRNQGGNFQEGPNRARDALNRGCLTHSLFAASVDITRWKKGRKF